MPRRTQTSHYRELIHTQITGLSHDGRGIARINGKTTFIMGALPGEEVSFIYTKRHNKFDEGQAQEIIKASPERATPLCPHFGVCGGCSLQHMNNQAQIHFKQEMLLEQLKHSGHIEPETILPLLPLVGPTTGYRHKGRLSVKYVIKKSKVLVGFREQDARFIADIQSCAVLHPSVGKKIADLSAFIEQLQIKDQIPQIEIAVDDTTTVLIIRHMQPLTNTDQYQLRTFAQTHHFQIYLQPAGMDSIHKFWPEDNNTYLNYQLPNYQLTLQFHPTDFTQVNPHINQAMITSALELLELNSQDQVLDLFCGLGNFTLPIARFCKDVVGVEGSMAMVERATHNAQLNGIKNAEFYCADLTSDFYNDSWARRQYNKILLDPPRTGAKEMINHIVKFKAQRIVYVSCNPATLARDAELLSKQGYCLKAAGVMDMFPHTSHVESIAWFEKD